MSEKIVVIGSGFSGLAAATSLAHEGYKVTLLEKNKVAGGRARKFEADGFTFDMGPSWYWMPDVFESYFNKFGKKVSDYYQLIRLDPSYKVILDGERSINIPANLEELKALFEKFEKGSSEQLDRFLKQSAYKYEVGINQLVYKPGRSLLEFANIKLLYDVLRMDIFVSFHKHIRKFFRHPDLIKLMEFPILFLGATSQNTPALYSLMNYADIALGTWYPMGGMHKIIEGIVKLAEENGVDIRLGQEVTKINIENGIATSVATVDNIYEADVIVAGADYHHIDQQVLTEEHRNYNEKYWENRVMAPSSLLYYLGIDKRVDNLNHHNLFFDEDFNIHSKEIYEEPSWPSKPLFYVSAPSKTDATVAPEGKENLFILIPVAPGLKDTEEIRDKYYHMVMDRLEKHTGTNIRDAVIYKRTFAQKDFINDYHAFKGNAYGLANTLTQTAILKPSLKNKKVKNLFYTGQLTVPGPGVPPSLISGQVVAKEVVKEYKPGKKQDINSDTNTPLVETT